MSSPTAAGTSTFATPQADPLPHKVGELGFIPSTSLDSTEAEHAGPNDISLHPHPAETPLNNPLTSSSTPSLPSSSTSVGSSKSGKQSLLSFLRGTSSTPMPTYFGVRLSTLLRILFITFALFGTIAAWVLVVTMILNRPHNAQNKLPPDMTPPDSPPSESGASSSVIFIHTAFGIVTVILLLLLERAVFIARAERYHSAHNDPSSSSAAGRARRRSGTGVAIGFAPWNRPSLPTYANALGFRGTGDVEDNVIAAPPPPEYGNTRGSTLLLSSVLQRSRQQQRYSGERPVSYRSHVEDGNGREGDDEGVADDAHRARRLEETLAALERSSSHSGGNASGVAIPRAAIVRN